MRRILPILDWLPSYNRGALMGDLTAGATVGVMLVPQGMAYAILAGLPPVYGLYAGLVPLIAYAVFGSSRHLAFGIMAIDCLIVLAAVSLLATPGSPEYIALVLLLTLMVGVIQLLLGSLRFGFVVHLLSRPVITGFTAAAAVIISMSQLKGLLGIAMPRQTDVISMLGAAAGGAGDIHMLTLGIGVAGMLLLFALRTWAPRVPGALVAVVLSTLGVWWFRLDLQGVDTVGIIPSGFPEFGLPDLDFEAFRVLVPTAVTLSLVQFMNVISIGKVFSARHGYRVDPNRELNAMGAANILGSLFQAVPGSGSFSRSAVGEGAGARSPMSNLVAAGVIALTMAFLTPLFFYLPTPIFAAIIIMAAISLLDIREIRFLLRTKRVDGIIALVTFAATLVLGIQQGILTGISLSVVAIMARIGRPHIAVLGLIPGTQTFRDPANHPEARPVKDILLMRMDASFSFVNAERLRDAIIDEVAGQEYRAVVIDAQSINDLDTTALAVLAELHETLAARDIALAVGGVKESVMRVVRESGLDIQMGPGHFYISPFDAVQAFLHEWGAPLLPVGLGGEPPQRTTRLD